MTDTVEAVVLDTDDKMLKLTSQEAEKLFLEGKIEPGTEVHVEGSLSLHSLTSLPEGVSLSAGKRLFVKGLTNEEQVYQGKKIRLRLVDDYIMRLISKRKIGDATLWSAQYFKGNLETDPRCYVVEENGIYAHGDTPEQALRDLRFKVAQASFDPDELAATIRQRGTVTFNDYRLITGACESGLRQGLKDRGIDPDVEELPLNQVLELCKDGYGGTQFIKAVGPDF